MRAPYCYHSRGKSLLHHYETQQERKALTTDLQSNPVEFNQQQRHLILLFQAVQRTSQNQFD